MTEQQRRRADLNLPKVLAAGLAAATAAVLGSFVGVAGTVTGAAVAAVISTLGSALYQRSLERTRETVRARISAARRRTMPGRAPIEPITQAGTAPARHASSRRRWVLVAGGTAAIFVFGMAAAYAVEKVHGAPLSGGQRGTNVGALVGEPTGAPELSATPEPPTSPSAPEPSSATSTPSPSATSTSTRPTSTSTPPTTTPLVPGLGLLPSPATPTPTPTPSSGP